MDAVTAAASGGVGIYEKLMFLVAEAIKRLEPSIRREYEEAVNTVPDLVANETRFLDFLRTEDMDPPRAALRLAMYWKYRKEIFGEDRWLLPMTQTGNGALSSEDIIFMRTGYTVAIRRHTGGPICLIDLSKLHVFPPGHTNTRIVFYLSTVLTDVGLQVEGVTFIHIVTSDRRPPVSTDPSQWNMFRAALPVRVKQLIVAQAYEPWKDALLDSLSYQVASSAGFKTRHHPNRIAGDSVKSVLQQLEAKGIPEFTLPRALGGTYEYSSFADWTRMRLSVEEIMSSAPLGPNMTFATQPANLELVPVTKAPQRQHERRTTVQTTTAERQGTREPSEMVDQRSHGAMSLAEQRESLQKRNNMLRVDNRRLEDLLAQAHAVLALHNSGEDNSFKEVNNID